MSDSLAVSAFGTLVNIGDGVASPNESFNTIAELRKIGGPKLALETIDVTVHNTPDPWRRFIGGLLNGGEVTMELDFIPTEGTHSYSTGLVHDMVNRVQRHFQLVFPDIGHTTWEFTALVTSFDVQADPGNVLIAMVGLKISEKPTLAG
jgi:hypothetical protein